MGPVGPGFVWQISDPLTAVNKVCLFVCFLSRFVLFFNWGLPKFSSHRVYHHGGHCSVNMDKSTQSLSDHLNEEKSCHRKTSLLPFIV